MEKRTRVRLAIAAMVASFLLVQLGALALVEPFKSAGLQTVEDPQDPANSVAYLAAILVATGLMLLAIRYDVRWLIRLFIVGTSGMLAYYVLFVVVPPLVVVGGTNALAALGGLAVVVALLVHPEWYVIDVAGILMGAGAAGLFGISFGILPALVLLTALAVYDAISVYGTEHMLALAEGVMDLHVPILLVFPTSAGYSFLEATEGDPAEAEPEADADGEGDGGDPPTADGPDRAGDASPVPDGEGAKDESGDGAGSDAETRDEPGDADGEPAEGSEDAEPAVMEREAFYIGLGDAVMPTIMVASAAFFLDAPDLGVPGIALNLPALTALLGTLAGLLVLMRFVMQGRAHAGLPLLNGGAIGGYLVGALAAGVPLAEALGLAAL